GDGRACRERSPRRSEARLMAIGQRTESDRLLAERERYVARGVATTPLIVARAEGAQLWDVDGREYVDFAGGLGCQNTGHGFGPFAPEVYRAPAPYPYRGVTSNDALVGLSHLFKQDVSPEHVACVVLEPVQGEGGFIPMPEDFPRRLKEVCDEHGILYVDDE